MSTKTLGVVGRGSGRQNSIPTIPTIPTVPTIPTIPTPWGCSKLKPNYVAQVLYFKEYQNCILGSKVTAFLLNVWILPISGVAS